jgi:L-galactose dehydrogenase
LTGHGPGRAGGPDPGGGLQEIDEEEGIAAVHEAFKLGINLFDTSPFYGKTKSETVLGKALKALPRNEIIVAKKVGRYGPEEFDFSAETVTREFYNSLERLCVDFVNVLQCHDIEFADMNQVRVGVRAVSAGRSSSRRPTASVCRL